MIEFFLQIPLLIRKFIIYSLEMANIIVVFPNKRIVETVLCFSIFLFCYLPTAFCSGFLQKLYLPVPGPESYAFDSAGRGPYASLADGRVLRYLGPAVGFVEYGYTKADRQEFFLLCTIFFISSRVCSGAFISLRVESLKVFAKADKLTRDTPQNESFVFRT